jgi:hypothetical protein
VAGSRNASENSRVDRHFYKYAENILRSDGDDRHGNLLPRQGWLEPDQVSEPALIAIASSMA